MEEGNIYIRALKYGEERFETGVVYRELLEHLGVEQNTQLETVFRMWFFDKFAASINANKTQVTIDWDVFKKSTPYFLTGDAYLSLMDYRELQEARKSSKQAMKIAIASILLAVVVGIAQIIIAL